MNSRPETHHGFKRITPENWLEPDVTKLFPDIPPRSWVEAHLAPNLSPQVPEDILALFEVARGAIIYGWFFYPLLTLGAEQTQRVMEAAARQRCLELGIAQPKVNQKTGRRTEPRFFEQIEALVARGTIGPGEAQRWKATRNLRNHASHPGRQTILSPGMAWGTLHTCAELINKLFA